MTVGNAGQISIDSYNLIFTGDGADTVPTSFPIGITTGTINFLSPSYGGKGVETKAIYLEMLFALNGDGTGTIELTGASNGGPEEYICSLALDSTAGVVESGIWRWADTIVLTQHHLDACSILVADSGNNRVCKFGLGVIGYKFIKVYSTALATVTAARVYARYFN